MKRIWLGVTGLVIISGLLAEARGAPVIFGALTMLGGWLRALPAPTEHWASIIGALAWPLAAALIVWWLKEPVALAAGKLAARFGTDDVELGSFLRVTNASLTTLDQLPRTDAPPSAEDSDGRVVERLLEFAAESDENAGRLRDWISAKFGPTWDGEEFLSDERFAADRRRALADITGDQDGG